ncbi:MAG: hypothetical protein QME07_02510 [bacterium]|nr:hypothetical protein [bacterium]
MVWLVVVLGMILGARVDAAGTLSLTVNWGGAAEQGSATSVTATVSNIRTDAISGVNYEIILPQTDFVELFVDEVSNLPLVLILTQAGLRL